ncbi:Cyclin-T [Nymphon striatum]|nr:Cyclin-T [Nymphon striatum]
MDVAASCLFLIGKVEENPRKIEQVTKTIFHHKNVIPNELVSELKKKHNAIIELEQRVLIANGNQDLAHLAYLLATETLHSTVLCLQMHPSVVACLCLNLAAKWGVYTIRKSSEGKHWIKYIDKTDTVTEEFLESATMRLIEQLEQKKDLYMKTFQDSNAASVLSGDHPRSNFTEQRNKSRHLNVAHRNHSSTLSAPGHVLSRGQKPSTSTVHRTMPAPGVRPSTLKESGATVLVEHGSSTSGGSRPSSSRDRKSFPYEASRSSEPGTSISGPLRQSSSKDHKSFPSEVSRSSESGPSILTESGLSTSGVSRPPSLRDRKSFPSETSSSSESVPSTSVEPRPSSRDSRSNLERGPSASAEVMREIRSEEQRSSESYLSASVGTRPPFSKDVRSLQTETSRSSSGSSKNMSSTSGSHRSSVSRPATELYRPPSEIPRESSGVNKISTKCEPWNPTPEIISNPPTDAGRSAPVSSSHLSRKRPPPPPSVANPIKKAKPDRSNTLSVQDYFERKAQSTKRDSNIIDLLKPENVNLPDRQSEKSEKDKLFDDLRIPHTSVRVDKNGDKKFENEDTNVPGAYRNAKARNQQISETNVPTVSKIAKDLYEQGNLGNSMPKSPVISTHKFLSDQITNGDKTALHSSSCDDTVARISPRKRQPSTNSQKTPPGKIECRRSSRHKTPPETPSPKEKMHMASDMNPFVKLEKCKTDKDSADNAVKPIGLDDDVAEDNSRLFSQELEKAMIDHEARPKVQEIEKKINHDIVTVSPEVKSKKKDRHDRHKSSKKEKHRHKHRNSDSHKESNHVSNESFQIQDVRTPKDGALKFLIKRKKTCSDSNNSQSSSDGVNGNTGDGTHSTSNGARPIKVKIKMGSRDFSTVVENNVEQNDINTASDNSRASNQYFTAPVTSGSSQQPSYQNGLQYIPTPAAYHPATQHSYGRYGQPPPLPQAPVPMQPPPPRKH